MGTLEALLDRVLIVGPAHVATFESLAAFRAHLSGAEIGGALPIDRAIVAGLVADRLGYAFAGGYDAALHALVPTLAADRAACLCVTEDAGAHPRAIRTTVERADDGLRVTGRKQWATLAGEGDVLLVAASEGWDGERNRIRLVEVPARAPGVTLTAMPATPFTPEIPHFRVALDGVRVHHAAVLPGDGYARYVKPFRTVEDLHVCAAAVAHLLRIARIARWPADPGARLVALLVSLRALALADPTAASVHVAVGGCLATLDTLLDATAPLWQGVAPEVAAQWHRDAPLLRVADRARKERLAIAWER